MMSKFQNHSFTATSDFASIEACAEQTLEFVQTELVHSPNVSDTESNSCYNPNDRWQGQDKELLGVLQVEPGNGFLKFVARNFQWINFGVPAIGCLGVLFSVKSFTPEHLGVPSIVASLLIGCILVLMLIIRDKLSRRLEVFDCGFRFKEPVSAEIGRQEVRWEDIGRMGSSVVIEEQHDPMEMESRRVTITYRLKNFTAADKSRRLHLLVEESQLGAVEFIDKVFRR